MIRYFRNIKWGIKNLFIWFPTIWDDRPWDYYYLFAILRFKLGLMEKAFRLHGHYVDAEKDAVNMKTCCDILDRLGADEYCEEAHKEHGLKWGRLDMKIDSDGAVNFSRPNVKTEEDEVAEREEFMECCKVEGQLEVDDVNKLFEIMSANVSKWWD